MTGGETDISWGYLNSVDIVSYLYLMGYVSFAIIAASRRDDLESWFYSLIFMATGDLPWINKKADPTGKRTVEIKKKTTH
jgi:hypothetical protein